MSNKKSTKRALALSVVSMLICVAMLLGTTFAWFTDTVTSGINQIVAGNLDVELYHTNDAVTTEEKVTESSDALFKDVALWEPGAVAYETFKVTNEGTLALKYDLSLNFAEQNTVNGKGLASALSVGVIDGALDANDDRADVIDDVNGNWQALSNFVKSGTLDAGTAGAPTSDTYTVVIYWEPKDNDNDWNVNNGKVTSDGEPLNIELGVKLFATQNTVEKDSFDNMYDEDAPAMEVATVADLQNTLNAGGKAVLNADINASTATPKNVRITIPEGTNAVIDLNGYKLTSKDGGGSNTMAIYVSRNATLTLEDSSAAGTGEVISSCYGIYVQPGAKFVMNGGTINVSGNGVYDIGVSVWNGEFIMNGGKINSKFAVWTSNYWRNNGEPAAPTCNVTIADGCTITSTGYADIDIVDAPDTILNVPSSITVND